MDEAKGENPTPKLHGFILLISPADNIICWSLMFSMSTNYDENESF